MERYNNSSGDSSVHSFEIGEGYIHLLFSAGGYRNYLYSNSSAGASVVLQMQNLAKKGDGLGSYIQRTKPHYERRW